MRTICWFRLIICRTTGLHSRVPQGSILGSLFFIIYVNDIVKAIKHSSCKLYADDLVLCIDDVDPAVACVKLQDDVNSLSEVQQELNDIE